MSQQQIPSAAGTPKAVAVPGIHGGLFKNARRDPTQLLISGDQCNAPSDDCSQPNDCDCECAPAACEGAQG